MAKVKVLTDVRVEVDPPSFYRWRGNPREQNAKELEGWAREFESFVRDHRSQDPISLNIVRDYEDQCSHCGYGWEVDSEGCPECCSAAQLEWDSERKKEAAA